jgi:N utilization substance protein A
VDLSGAEAVLPVREQVPRESFRAGDRIVAYVVDIDKSARGPQIIISRGHKGLLEKLFEMEVPEIYDKIVRVEASAREPGARSKIAVSSRDRDVDPVGACVGMKGSRVQAVVQELRGEKIDIVPYDNDPARFVCNAIAPAQVSRVMIDAANHTMELVVPDDKLSLAIGKKGQNVRLASQLTNWRIDIHSEAKMREAEERARASLTAIEGATPEILEALLQAGWGSAEAVARASLDELRALPGVGSPEAAASLSAAAGRAAVIEEQRRAEEKAEYHGAHSRKNLHRLSVCRPGQRVDSPGGARRPRGGRDPARRCCDAAAGTRGLAASQTGMHDRGGQAAGFRTGFPREGGCSGPGSASRRRARCARGCVPRAG